MSIIKPVTKKTFLMASVLFTVLVALIGLPTGHVFAEDSVTAEDLISLVNGIRTGNGLPALQENSILDGTAQWTAQTMADNSSETHLGGVTDRVASSGYGGGQNVAATENFAFWEGGLSLASIQALWADSAHMLPMTDPKYTDIGAGVATNPTTHRVYYVVHAAYVLDGTYSGGTGSTGGGGSSSSATASVSQIVIPVVTSTPHVDGSVIHVVQQGQTLWGIAMAYGTHIGTLQALNNLGTSNSIYVNEQLHMPSAKPPNTPTITATVAMPTRTIISTRVLPTVVLSSATPSAGVTAGDFAPDRRTLGMIIIVICVLGLGVVMLAALRRR
jgi:LysM repeat protein